MEVPSRKSVAPQKYGCTIIWGMYNWNDVMSILGRVIKLHPQTLLGTCLSGIYRAQVKRSLFTITGVMYVYRRGRTHLWNHAEQHTFCPELAHKLFSVFIFWVAPSCLHVDPISIGSPTAAMSKTALKRNGKTKEWCLCNKSQQLFVISPKKISQKNGRVMGCG